MPLQVDLDPGPKGIGTTTIAEYGIIKRFRETGPKLYSHCKAIQNAGNATKTCLPRGADQFGG
jgi:hypothetical protein